MSKPVTIRGQKWALLLGNGADPEVFTPVCGITTKGLQRTNQTSDTVVWDCEDPDAQPSIERDILAGDWNMSGAGQAVLAELDRLEAALKSIETWRLVLYGTGTTIVRTYTGPAVMTDLTIGAANGGRATISLSLAGAGELITGPVAP